MVGTMHPVSEETKRKVYESFGKNEKMVEDDVELIKKWMKSQKHLPELMEDVKIRNFLNLNKYSLEKTKKKIDMYYTIRGLIPDFFEKSNPKLDHIKRLFETTYVLTFPGLLDNVHHVFYSKLRIPNTLDMTNIFRVWFNIFEIHLYEDFMVNDVVFVDLTNCTLRDFTNIPPTVIANILTIYQNVFSLRLKRLFFMNCPSYVTIFATLLKSVMKQKIFDRIEFHEDDAIIKKMLPEEMLPKDYGGEGKSLEELNGMVQKKLAEYQDRFDRLDQLKVNESLRPEKLNNDEILGFYGSFKKIDVD